MKIFLGGSLSAIALVACALPLAAQTTEPSLELAFMPRAITVTLLNDGGKYVVVDQKHIAQGESCRMDKDATIARVGPGGTQGTTRVRYIAAQVSSGGCPFLTAFDMSNADYATARIGFVQMKDEAWRKVEAIKKELGEKWGEVIAKKS